MKQSPIIINGKGLKQGSAIKLKPEVKIPERLKDKNIYVEFVNSYIINNTRIVKVSIKFGCCYRRVISLEEIEEIL